MKKLVTVSVLLTLAIIPYLVENNAFAITECSCTTWTQIWNDTGLTDDQIVSTIDETNNIAYVTDYVTSKLFILDLLTGSQINTVPTSVSGSDTFDQTFGTSINKVFFVEVNGTSFDQILVYKAGDVFFSSPHYSGNTIAILDMSPSGKYIEVYDYGSNSIAVFEGS